MLFAVAYVDELRRLRESELRYGNPIVPDGVNMEYLVKNDEFTQRILEAQKRRQRAIVTAAFKSARKIVDDLCGEIDVDALNKEEARDWFSFCVAGLDE